MRGGKRGVRAQKISVIWVFKGKKGGTLQYSLARKGRYEEGPLCRTVIHGGGPSRGGTIGRTKNAQIQVEVLLGGVG